MATAKSESISFAVLAVDTVCVRVHKGKVEVLLGPVDIPPHYRNMKGVIGGLIHPDETAEQAVERHLRDKAGIEGVYKEQVHTFSRVDRDPRGRVVAVAYLCPVEGDPRDAKKAKLKTEWVDIKDAEGLAYDHDEIVWAALEHLRNKLTHSNIAREILPKEFTLTELQDVYEIIFNRKFDKRNFRKKVLSIGMLKATGKKTTGTPSRPAELYTFVSPTQVEMGVLG